ncbi:hypothetical protein FOL47_003133 [Perkinsus chesapeaki]|uniref:Uncharacterized protein n=1 Tax=Perkinsus chesapeaki TaxID=330153 RepID=A0A7J6MAL1_PERCH|nr:hypothetical protein FOL47_003133 [Perkinsus chesapeaki]
MQLAHTILLVTAFTCTSELKGGSSGSGCYEKPVGDCYPGGENCTCQDPYSAFGYPVPGGSPPLAIVCSKQCSEMSDCPTMPNFNADCVGGLCGLRCNNQTDCLEGEKCIDVCGDYMCMFPYDDEEAVNRPQPLIQL